MSRFGEGALILDRCLGNRVTVVGLPPVSYSLGPTVAKRFATENQKEHTAHNNVRSGANGMETMCLIVFH